MQKLAELTLLNLRGNKVADVTPLQGLNKLTQLYLGGNKVADVTSLQGLDNLTQLYLGGNKIADITPLQRLNKLAGLYLSGNRIADITPLQELKQLNKLSLSGNAINDIMPLQNLTQLTQLYLAGNAITDLTSLQKLTHLVQLDLRENKIINIDSLQELTQLTQLYLGSNKISNLTPLQTLTQLTQLYLGSNKIINPTPLQTLTQLIKLELNDNAINNITKSILNLKSLDLLRLGGNPIQNIPKELIEKEENCLKLLKDYYQSTEGETEFLYEAKMVLVGNGRVGKTTISKNIIGNYGIYDNEESTHGIEVRKWDCKFSKEDLKTLFSRLPPQVLAANVNWTKLKNEGFRLNIWDFGGQGKYRAVQQFFCSRNSLYLYVTSVDDEFINKNDVYINFSYWIPFISTFGFNQSQNHKSPVIYIYNKTDKIQGSGLEKKKRIKDQVEVASKGESFVNVSDVIDISCNNAKDIEALRTQIRQILPFISDDVFTRRYGKGWLDTKQELESLNEAFIFKERYVSIFKINVRKYQELALVEEESQAETWLTVLDAIGSVIYFSEEKVKIVVQEDNKKPVHLSQIVILQPEWLKEIAYEVLNCEVVINRRGEFDAHDFDKIWPKVAPQQYDLLIQMMLAFELCYHSDKFGREIYVVPALFPEQTPLDYQQQGFEELAGTNIVQKYVLEFSPFMPAGVLHKLVIAKNGWIYQEIKWLTGVVLHGKNTYIEITEQWDKSTITLMIAGERPDWMRDEIINEIRRITDSVRSTKYLYELKFDVKRINPMEKPGNTMVPIRVFISYSHAYKEYYQVFKDKFETGTKPLQHNGNYKIEIYSDEQIPLGSNWHTELQREVLNCDIAILLISDTFFTSEYIRQQELNRFIDRHNNNQILIVPIYFHPCDYDSWGKLQEIQFFKPEGAKYGRPELGTSFSFSDLVNFYSANGQLMVTPNLNISRYMTDMVNKLKPEFARIASKKIEQ